MDGYTTEATGDHRGPDVFPRIGPREGDDVRSGRHDLLGVFGPKIHNALENALFFLRAFGVVGELKRSFQVFHADFCHGGTELSIKPFPHGHKGPPSRLQDFLRGHQGCAHEFGQFDPKRSGVDFGNDLAKQHQQHRHTDDVNQSVEPSGEGFAREHAFCQHGSDQDNGNVDQVVDDENGAQQISRTFGVVGGAQQIQNPSGGRRIFRFKVVQRLWRQTEKGDFRTRDQGGHDKKQTNHAQSTPVLSHQHE